MTPMARPGCCARGVGVAAGAAVHVRAEENNFDDYEKMEARMDSLEARVSAALQRGAAADPAGAAVGGALLGEDDDDDDDGGDGGGGMSLAELIGGEHSSSD
jgi:hypothetical protein